MTFPVNFLRLCGIISLLCVTALLQACSAVKIAYNQAPQLAYLYLDGYADFNGVQSLQVKAELAKFQVWHRQTQLPGYIDLLQNLQQKMQQDITQQQACDVFANVRQKAFAITDYIEPAALGLAATLGPKQIAAIQSKFDKGNTSWREDFLDGSAKELMEKREKSAIKRADMLYGNVTDKQRIMIAQQIEKSQFKPAQNYAERQRRQKDVLQTLGKVMATPQDTAAAQKEMRSLLARTISSPDATYKSYQDAITQESCVRFAELHNTTTPEQRKKAAELLAGYEQDFKVLVSQR